ncbi:hypothetical protein NEF87_002414 [Candidatus Lokiarchaeum ossiferum]|uniref:AB hydrolase-1 domain-containing protein n=1 Tax=Candidatus Lokiarchaeum ossiferum TaxID=2951803 RepID=A0ABY6HUA7_9ARCH|nr:hypothetical protein NEF87_002414 [Candidatus Lokiarchaeum sp. B-35]
MPKHQSKYGHFSNGLEYVALGTGEKKVLFFLGGPGNEIPHGIMLQFYSKPFTPLIENYTLYLISRKSDLPSGYTTIQMAADYAEMIKNDLGGKVHGVIGFSYGGMILQHFCALYPNLADKFILLSASHKTSEIGLQLDCKYARLLSKGKFGSAFALIATAVYPKGLKRTVIKPLIWLLGTFSKKPSNKTYSQDVLIEYQAEENHNADENLRKIRVPVVIVCGDQDYYMPLEGFEEMYDLIPEAKLKIFHGKGHDVFEDPQAINYILKELQNIS